MTAMEREQIDGLKRQRGAAVLDGAKTDKINAAIAAAETEFQTIEDVEVERVRRGREQEAKDAAAKRRAQIKHIADLEQRRQAAWSKLENTTRTLVEEIREVVDVTESERVLAGEIAPPVPSALGPYECQHRLKGRIAELLGRAHIAFRVAGFGGVYSRIADWKEIERNALAPYIEKLENEDDKN